VLPTKIRQDIIERTDGIPLFVEEMTKALLEAEGEGSAMQIAAAVPSPAVAVPASLHASLMARLDRLGPAKEVVQTGAAIGREFSHALLAAVVRTSETELNSALKQLIAAGLLARQGVAPYSTYLFKHALLQDAAYGTLLREPRRALHARIAKTLESQFAELAETRPELLARQCADAGLIEKAAARPDSDHWSALRWSKRSPCSPEPSTKLRRCPQRRRCAASRPSCRSALQSLCIIQRAFRRSKHKRHSIKPAR
jgi:predicted ATPase